MPFSVKRKILHNIKIQLIRRVFFKKIKKPCSLQVLRQNRKKYLLQYNMLKRVFSFASEKGSLTLEATFVTSLFVFAIVAIMGVIAVIDLQQNIRIVMENIGRETSQTFYYMEELKEEKNKTDIENKVDSLLKKQGSNLSEEDREKFRENMEETAFIAYIYGKFVSELKMEDINESYILGGIAGLDFTRSTYKSDTGEVDIVLKYKIKVPFISDKIWKIEDCQRVYVKVWNGKDIRQTEELVYITKNGTVYHTSKSCPHLDLKVSKNTYGKIGEIRNKAGSKYKKCKLCKLKECTEATVVYVTDYGTAYHFSLSCGGISRSIIQIDKKFVGDRRLCKDCEERE